jgi:transposase InsO family protein
LEIKHLRQTTSRAVIDKCRQVFATHGILDEFHSDNGPQFVSHKFKVFAETYGFDLTTYFAQANGQAEGAVKAAKRILSTLEPDIGLLNCSATPQEFHLQLH